MGRTLREQGPDGVRREEKPETEQPPSKVDGSGAGAANTAKTGAVAERDAAVPPSTPPQRPAAGGNSLATLLIQNRTKTGQQKVLEEGAPPSQAQPPAPTGSFDLLEVTAVGGVQGGDNGAGASPGSGTPGKGAAGEVPERKKYPTPGGGLPGLLARTQLGLGDAIRAFRESAGRMDAATPALESPASASAVVAPLVGTAEAPPAASPPPASSGETTAVASTAGGEGAVAVSGPVFELATGPVAGSGSVSGPVFDLVSGAFSGAVTAVNPTAPRVAGTPAAEAAPPPSVVTAAQVTPRVAGTPAAEATPPPVATAAAEATPPSASTEGDAVAPAPAATEAGAAAPAAVSVAGAGATPSTPAEQAAPRQSWSTPASGRLAALLAESRKRTGRHEILDRPAARPPSEAGPAGAVPEPVPTSTASASGAVPASPDVDTIRVPGAELAQKKGPGFAATLLGLPAPELTPPVLRTGAASAPGETMASRARHLRDGSRGAGADRSTPLPVEGDATERSLLSTGDMRARWSRSSEEQKRTTEIVDIVRANRSGLKTAALILGSAAVLVAIMVAVAQSNRSGGDERNAATSGPGAPVPSATARSAAPGAGAPTPVEDQPPAAAAIAPAEAAAGQVRTGETDRGEAARAEASSETKASRADDKAAAPAEEAEGAAQPLPSAFRETGSSAVARGGDGEPKRKVSRAESRRSDTRRAEPKTRRRTAEARTTRTEGTATAASYEPPRPRVAQPLHPLQADPDGTLPLGMQ